MSLDSFQTLVLAALLHDFGEPNPRALVAAVEADDRLAPMFHDTRAWASSGGQHNAALADGALVSILALLKLNDEQSTPLQSFSQHALASTNEDWKFIFPSINAKPDADYLARLRERLNTTVANLAHQPFDVQLNHSAALLQQYAWCLPAHDPEISLYDHARLTAALAACLYRGRDANAPSDRPLRLAVGDLSGIQSYIFDIATVGATGASRRLRARSFSIAILSDLASHALVHLFDLPLTNILMSSGGKFYVLLPNIADADTRIQNFRRRVDKWLYDTYNFEIGLNLASLPLGKRELAASRPDADGFGAFVGNLNRELEQEKNLRGASIFREGDAWSETRFAIRQDFGGSGDCASCHKFKGDQRDGLCEQCARQSRLGSRLTRAWGVAFMRGGQAEAEDITFLDEYRAQVLTEAPSSQPSTDLYLLTRLNDPDLSRVINYPATFRFIANHVERGAYDAPLDFEEIANRSKGRDLLGYVKADVDNLGILMAEGLRYGDDATSRDTAGHVMALSRELELFFTGWLEHLLETQIKNAYTIFSGGDDLFLLVPWSESVALAQNVNEHFRDFACANPDVTLSAGILYSKSSYPISRAAQDVEETLEQSKQGGRNRLTVLGKTVEWQGIDAILNQARKLGGFTEQDLRSAFLYRLIDYAGMYHRAQRAKTADAARYKSHFAYTVARNLRDSKREVRDWADGILKELFDKDKSDTMENLDVIATTVLFTRRTRREQ